VKEILEENLQSFLFPIFVIILFHFIISYKKNNFSLHFFVIYSKTWTSKLKHKEIDKKMNNYDFKPTNILWRDFWRNFVFG